MSGALLRAAPLPRLLCRQQHGIQLQLQRLQRPAWPRACAPVPRPCAAWRHACELPAVRSYSTGASGSANASASPTVPAPTFVDRLLPPSLVPYAKLTRIDRPIGTWLLMFPGWWSIALAAPPGGLPDASLLATFAVGALVMRGAGCTINDMWDKNLDAKVERTASRPLAAGLITRFQALQFLGLQLSVGLAILLTLNMYSIVLGAASVLLVVLYPLMKRVTYWPQLVLGLTFNWGALLGWSAARGACDWAVVVPLYAAGVAWTLVYDTLYAHQDKRDDARVGIRSTALRFGERTPQWLTAFSALAGAGLAASGAAAGVGWPFFAAAAASTAHLLHQTWTARLEDAGDCQAKFESNFWVGLLIFLGALLSRRLQEPAPAPAPAPEPEPQSAR